MTQKFDNNFYIKKTDNGISFHCSTFPEDIEFSISSILHYLKDNNYTTCNVFCGEVTLNLTNNANASEVAKMLKDIQLNLNI